MEPMIKYCPFCGHTATIYEYQKETFYIVCDYCGTSTTMYPTEEEATLAWNTRFEPKTDSKTTNENTLKYTDEEPWHNRIKYTNDKPWETM